MSVEIRVPSLGESVTEATVARWFKQIGDAVTADEPLVELETDKVTLEYNAPASGILSEILVEQGGEVEVGALLGAINDDGADSEEHAETTKIEEKPDQQVSVDHRNVERPMSPAVRKLAEEHELDLSSITPSGPKGNITKGDVLSALKREDSVIDTPATPPVVVAIEDSAKKPDKPASSERRE